MEHLYGVSIGTANNFERRRKQTREERMSTSESIHGRKLTEFILNMTHCLNTLFYCYIRYIDFQSSTTNVGFGEAVAGYQDADDYKHTHVYIYTTSKSTHPYTLVPTYLILIIRCGSFICYQRSTSSP